MAVRLVDVQVYRRRVDETSWTDVDGDAVSVSTDTTFDAGSSLSVTVANVRDRADHTWYAGDEVKVELGYGGPDLVKWGVVPNTGLALGDTITIDAVGPLGDADMKQVYIEEGEYEGEDRVVAAGRVLTDAVGADRSGFVAAVRRSGTLQPWTGHPTGWQNALSAVTAALADAYDDTTDPVTPAHAWDMDGASPAVRVATVPDPDDAEPVAIDGNDALSSDDVVLRSDVRTVKQATACAVTGSSVSYVDADYSGRCGSLWDQVAGTGNDGNDWLAAKRRVDRYRAPVRAFSIQVEGAHVVPVGSVIELADDRLGLTAGKHLVAQRTVTVDASGISTVLALGVRRPVATDYL